LTAYKGWGERRIDYGIKEGRRKKEGMRLNLQKNISQVSMVRGNFSLGPGKEAREG